MAKFPRKLEKRDEPVRGEGNSSAQAYLTFSKARFKTAATKIIDELESQGNSNIALSKSGSPVTNMEDDHVLGEIGKEQLALAKKIRELMKEVLTKKRGR